jgi:ABC-type Fe3+ transport system permease subunit
VVWSEIIVGSLIVLLLLGLSFHFGRLQLVALRKLRQSPDLPVEEQRYERSKAHRRLVSCALTLLLAFLMAVLLFFTHPSQRWAELADLNREYTEEQKVLLRIWGWTLVAALLVLLLVLALAAIDLLSTRRYGLKQYRKLQADRRAMIERQANRIRRERNGHG